MRCPALPRDARFKRVNVGDNEIQFGGDCQEEKGKVIDYLSLRHGYYLM